MVDLASVKTSTKDLVHWVNPVASGSTLGFVLACLVSICYFSLISVIAYISMTLLIIVLCIKIYSYAMVFMKKVGLQTTWSLWLVNCLYLFFTYHTHLHLSLSESEVKVTWPRLSAAI